MLDKKHSSQMVSFVLIGFKSKLSLQEFSRILPFFRENGCIFFEKLNEYEISLQKFH